MQQQPEVLCDMCGKPMVKLTDSWGCYECPNQTWESDLWRYDISPPSKEDDLDAS